MLVTSPGMVEPLHPIINVLLSFSIIALQLLRESYFVLPASTVIVAKLLQSAKTPTPMLVTLAGMVTDVKLEQNRKAS